MARTAGTRRTPRVAAALACGVLVTTLSSGCFAEPTPVRTIRDFLVAWQSGRYEDAAKKTTGDHSAVASALGEVRDQLDAVSLTFALGPINPSGEQADAHFTVKVDLGENGEPWVYGGQLRLRRLDGQWKVLWSPSVIHPSLRDGQRLAVVTETPERAPVQDAKGNSLLRTTPAEVVGVYPRNLQNPQRTLGDLAGYTKLDKDRLLGRVRSAPPQSFLRLVTLQQPTHSELAAKLRQVPGLVFRSEQLPATPSMAAEFVGNLGPATAERLQQVGAPYQPGDTIGESGLQLLYQRQLAGTPTVKVIAQDPTGREVMPLREWPGAPSTRVRTTLNQSYQSAAERALSSESTPAALTAVHAATGEVLAAANHLTGQDLALDGRYPPGMAFAIVSTEALLQKGQQLGAPAPCPPTQTVGGQVFRNSSGAPEGNSSFQVSFARGCTTAFAGLGGTLDRQTLMDGVKRFGLGGPWGLSVPAFPGSVPQPANEAELASTIVGQGKVLMSPLSMALIAGAVNSGTWRPPQLLNEPLLPQLVQAQPLNPIPIRGLLSLMRRAVTQGSAKDANLPGTAVYGVASNVQYDVGGTPKTVSWFVGFRGATAFAVAVEGQNTAAKVAARFLQGL